MYGIHNECGMHNVYNLHELYIFVVGTFLEDIYKISKDLYHLIEFYLQIGDFSPKG